MNTITAADLTRLLASDAPDARLILSEGHVDIHTGDDDAGGGIIVTTRADLLDRVGDPPDQQLLTEHAALLSSDIGLLGA